MLSSFFTQDILAMALALAAGGVVMGIIAGLFGIGGGGVVVPILYELFKLQGVPEEIRMHLCIGTSLAVMIPTTLRSAQAHAARHSVEWPVVRRLVPPVLVGVVLGTLIATTAPSTAFKLLWVLFTTTMAIKLALGKDQWQLGSELPSSRLVEAYGVFIGTISTLLSIAGGIFVTMLLSLYGRPLTKAVGTASAVGPFVAIAGAVGFVWAGWGNPLTPSTSIGFVSPLAAVLAVPTSVLAAPIGVRLAHGLSKRQLELAMAGFFALVGLRFALSLVFR
jgi:uncharacterized membrane protein YfcA